MDFTPSPARLHAALLNAAAQGSLSSNGQPTEASIEALKWLESHPPTAISEPPSVPVNSRSQRFMFREVSSLNKKRRTEQRAVSDGIAVAGSYGFQWEDVPESISNLITLLAEDVSCLGETHSLAVLTRHEDFNPTAILDEKATAFTPGRLPRDVAKIGRTEELCSIHTAGRVKTLSVAKDRISTSEKPVVTHVTHTCVTTALYKPVSEEPSAKVPWQSAYLFTLSRGVAAHECVELCTAMHGALISRINQDVSPMITGKYGDGVPRATNRLAIQYIPREYSHFWEQDAPLLALFVPFGASDAELQQVARAEEISALRSRRIGKIGIRFTHRVIHGDKFWPAPKQNNIRVWRPLVPVIPETRHMSSDKRAWNLSDAGLLSLAFVWRDQFTSNLKGQKRYWDLRDKVAAQGALVCDARTFPKHESRYVHRIHNDLVVQPYSAVFMLGNLASDRTAVMVGQSRHLGGGLLFPYDIPVDFNSSEKDIDHDARNS